VTPGKQGWQINRQLPTENGRESGKEGRWTRPGGELDLRVSWGGRGQRLRKNRTVAISPGGRVVDLPSLELCTEGGGENAGWAGRLQVLESRTGKAGERGKQFSAHGADNLGDQGRASNVDSSRTAVARGWGPSKTMIRGERKTAG